MPVIRVFKAPVMLACVGMACFAWTSSARGAISPPTFAQFVEANTGADANEFAYLDNGSDAQLASDAPIPVVFQFTMASGLPADLQGPQTATLTLHSATQSPAQVPGGTIADQPIGGDVNVPVNTLTIARTTPAAEGTGQRTNLLTMIFTGDLIGKPGLSTPQLSGNADLGDEVSFTSDFLPAMSDGNFSLTFSSWITTADGNGLELDSLGKYFQSATAAGTGTFAAIAVPEPTSAPAVGLVGLLGLLVRRR
jgi:hypothetical protein